MAGKYQAIDAEIVRLIAEKPRSWGAIHANLVASFPSFYWRVGNDDWRLTDRRIQALRKAGKILPRRDRSSSVWELSTLNIASDTRKGT